MLASELSEPGILLRQLGRAGHRKFWLKVSPDNYPMGPTLRLSQNWSVQYIALACSLHTGKSRLRRPVLRVGLSRSAFDFRSARDALTVEGTTGCSLVCFLKR